MFLATFFVVLVVKCCPQESLPARPSTMLPEEVRFLPVTAIHRAESSQPSGRQRVASTSRPTPWRPGEVRPYRRPAPAPKFGIGEGRKGTVKVVCWCFLSSFQNFLDCLYVEWKIANQGWSTSENSFGQLEWTTWPWLFFLPFLAGKGFGQRKRPVWLAGHIPGDLVAELLGKCNTVTFSDRVVVSNTCLIFTPDPWGMIQFDYIP